MDPDRWARAKEIFRAVHECDAGGRDAYLREACAGDLPLREAVETMLADEAGAAGFLEAPALEVEAMAIARVMAEDRPSGRSATVSGIPAESAPANLPPPIPAPATRRRLSARPPWWILALAAVFVADFLLKTWCYALGPAPLGYRTRVEGGRHVVAAVTPLSAADRAGMRTGDIIAARDGQPYDRVAVSRVTHPNLEIGQDLGFEIERDGQRRQLTMTVRRVEPIGAGDVGVGLLWYAPAGVMLATAVLIGVKRPRDAVARMGALTLATLAVGLYRFNLPGGYAVAWRSAPLGLGTLLWIPNVCIALFGPIGMGFFARFPRPLFRARWLWGLVWLPTACTAPVDLYTLFLRVYHPSMAYAQPGLAWTAPASAGLFGLYGIAMVAAIAANYLRLSDSREKRRLRVLIAGGAVGALPGLVRFVAGAFAGGSWLAELPRVWGSGPPHRRALLPVPTLVRVRGPQAQDPRCRRHREDRRAVCARERPRPLARAASWRDPGRGRAGSRRPAPHRDRAGARVGVRDAGRPRGAGAHAASPDGPRARPPVLP